jgi:sugar (pentulose or hexulose) kinase
MRALRTILVLAATLSAVPALAQSKTEEDLKKGLKGKGAYGLAGCGLGSMAFGGQPGGIQIIAATLNSICGNQTFGITFGTSNCGPGLLAQGTRNFVEANREAVAKDVARGEGEAIGALTVINRCADSRAVGAALQARFQVIFPSAEATDEEVTRAILETLHGDAALGCGNG